MKIADAEVFLLQIPLEKPLADSISKWNRIEMIVLKVISSSGLEGWGFNWTIGIGGDMVRDMLSRYLIPTIRGMNLDFSKIIPDQIYERNTFLWDYRLGKTGLAQMGMCAIDMALWDIRCKSSDVPLWKYLGACRDTVPAYNTDVGWLSWSVDELINNIRGAIRDGFTAVKIKVGKSDPSEDYDRIKRVREAVGGKVKIMADVNTKWDVNTAIKWGKKLEDHDIFWLEEPISPLDVTGHAKIASALRTPIAVGESIYSKYTFREYINANACEVAQPDATKVTGITEWLEVASLASANNVPIVPHTNIQFPVHVQLGASTPNVIMVEYVPWCTDVWKEPIRLENGNFVLQAAPGLGTEIKSSMIEQYGA